MPLLIARTCRGSGTRVHTATAAEAPLPSFIAHESSVPKMSILPTIPALERPSCARVAAGAELDQRCDLWGMGVTLCVGRQLVATIKSRSG